MYHIFFIHLSVSGHLVCFHVLAIRNRAAMNTGVNISFPTSVSISWDTYLDVKLLNDMGVSSFFRTHHNVFSACHTNLHCMCQACLLSTSSPIFVICGLFDASLSDRYEVIYHCGFDMHFSDN